MGRYNEELRKAGMLLALDGLQPPSDGASVVFEGAARRRVIDGPFTEAKEVVGGYWIIQARSTEEAVEWAKRCPGENCRIEVRRDLRDGGLPAGRAGGDRLRPGSAPGRLVAAPADARAAVETVWRIESARLIAGLARLVRDVGLAEDLAQDALVAALERWPRDGVPDNPGAWLMATAKNRAIDLARRAPTYERKREEIAHELGLMMAMDGADLGRRGRRRGRRRPAGADVHLLPPARSRPRRGWR